MPKLVIIDYGSGNLRSVTKALEKVGAPVQVTSDAAALDAATHIVLPGVGAFGDCMSGLKALPGMIEALKKNVLEKKKPFLGICVGMQLLFERGHEYGVHEGLGWLKGEVVPLSPAPGLKIPHMGWNELKVQKSHALVKDIASGDHAYFVHSFHAACKNQDDILATTDYGHNIVAIVAKDNIMGTQFHPEKSQAVGLALLKNFLGMQ